ncbi:MAG TPA: hypothetical protein VIY86_11655, partial [Pirellulaceae bacterium]
RAALSARESTVMAKHFDHSEYPKRIRNLTDDALRYILKDAGEALRAMPTGGNSEYYADEINYASMELKARRDRMARSHRRAG